MCMRTFDHFPHQSVDRAPGRRDELQHIGAADFLVERPLDGLDLPANAAHTVQELGFLSDGMGHGLLQLCLQSSRSVERATKKNT
jgi:hypothetical protein